MTDRGARLSLEERLAALRAKMEDGLPRRAAELRGAVDRLAAGAPDARAEIGRLAHKLRGTAGTHGHAELDERATEVETLARENGDRESADHALLCARTLALIAAIGRARVAAQESAAGSTSSADRPAVRTTGVPSPGAGALRGRRVLAIDDDSSTRRLLELTLSKLGEADAQIVASPEDALRDHAVGAFDLVVVDAMMPSMTGLEFARSMRALDSGVPIAFLSAATQDELGWTLPPRSMWLRKPFRPFELLEALVRILDGAAD